MKVQSLTIPSDLHTMAATIVWPKETAKAGLICLRGGLNVPHWPNTWQEGLAKAGVVNLCFDYVGVGDTKDELPNTNLLTRLDDARLVPARFLAETGLKLNQIYVMGISMGAPIAIWLATEMQPKGLVISSPAAYGLEAHDKNFGPDFSAAIRAEGSYRNSQEFALVEAFPGRVMLAFGENDDIIPREILDRYAGIVGQKGGHVLRLQAGHDYLREQTEATAAKAEFWRQLKEFVLEPEF